jgi:hypothetical protein
MTTPSQGPHPKATAALGYAKRLKAQSTPAIWFDSWYNDERDNISTGGSTIPPRDPRATTVSTMAAPSRRR